MPRMLKHWDGATWQFRRLKYWDGSSWVPVALKWDSVTTTVPVAHFDGTDDRAEALDSVSLKSPTTAITLAGWIRPHGTSQAYGQYFSKGHSGGHPWWPYGVFQQNTFLGELGTWIGGGNTTTAGGFVALNEWRFLALTWRSGEGITIRSWEPDNDTPVVTHSGTAHTGTIAYPAQPLYIGGAPGEHAAVDMARWGIHNAVLSDAQLKTWRDTGTPPIILAGAFYPLDGNWTDIDKGNNATVVNGAIFSNTSVPWSGVEPSRLFLPTSLPSLRAWYDFSDAATITSSGSSIASITDKSHNNHTATQATLADQPTLTSPSQNGLQVSTYISNDHLTSPVPANDLGVTWVMAAKVNNFAGYRTFFGGHSTYVGFQLRANQTSGTLSLLDMDRAVLATSSSALTAGQWHIITVTYSTAGVTTFHIDGVAAGSGTHLRYPNAGTTFIGKHRNNAEPFDGDIGDWIKYDRILTAEERSQVENYLISKWTPS